MLDHLARNWGNWASVAGLVFSILAFVFSKRASKAAEEARSSILRKSLGQDLNDANRTASEIVRYVSMERGDMALLRTSELLNQASYFITRWETRLPEQSRANLLRAREQLLSIHDVLTRSAIAELEPAKKARLAQSCQRVNLIFSEECGAAMKATDREA